MPDIIYLFRGNCYNISNNKAIYLATERRLIMTMIDPELSYKLYSDEIIYRPPPESESILLQVAVGCSYSECTFCREQAHHRFKAYPLAEVEEKIAILASLPENKHKKELFFVGENCLVLPTQHLVAILQAVHELLPQVEHINIQRLHLVNLLDF